MLQRIEEQGGAFRDAGRNGDLLEILKRRGCNCFRLRLFVNPNGKDGVVNDLPYTRAMARRIKAAGAAFMLDVHYSDTWADPAHQTKPAAWRDLDFDALEKKVADYTAEVIADLARSGTPPDIVQIGNEITPGMLWPDGRLQGDNPEQWQRFARLVKAGIRGARSATPGNHRLRIMIHIDRGGDWQTTKWYFDRLNRHDVAYDIIGLSYYPWWHGPMQNLRENLRRTAEQYGKDIVVVETAYPWRGAEGWSKKKNMDWPISPQGQAEFLSDLIEATRSTPGGHGLGVLYWYPEAIPVKGLNVWNGGSTALFDENGNTLPAVDALRSATPFTYRNPIYFQGKTGKDEVRDPCIIREGDTYYLVFTVWPFRGRDEKHLNDPDQGSSPGIKLFSSKDLLTWTFENWLVKSSELPEDCPYKHRFWAPEIHKIGGRFYLIFTADNADIGLDFRHEYLEAPWPLKIHGKYCLFYAGPYQDKQTGKDLGYWTGAAYAGSPAGPWKKDPCGRVFWGGHMAVFSGPGGRNWFSYRGEQHPQTRGFLCIDPCDVGENGLIRTSGPSTETVSAPR